MKHFVVIALCLALLTGIAAVSMAADNGMTGRNELITSGSWTKFSVEGQDLKLTLLGARYGKFITENLEPEIGLIYAKAKVSGESLSALALSPAISYNFVPKDASKLVPYVGAGFTYARVKAFGDSESTTKFQYFGGVKYYFGGTSCMDSNKAVFLEYRHNDLGMGGLDLKANTIWSGVAVSF